MYEEQNWKEIPRIETECGRKGSDERKTRPKEELQILGDRTKLFCVGGGNRRAHFSQAEVRSVLNTVYSY
jgi:hypothetical protein